ncbi:hypothetical protein [Algibacter pectinivorans]|uniref:Uncharacterized protein n=1 Tax=Algibacter pectinivorans TaxID=870482 RepID=A0A1I1MSY4_9FLAO|nr:hypothetical protein [Algibacter pectinivorans]SFC88501.1 hypothetical protein SAMN04487987_101511 [Algibacter pectinivorans]
MNTFEVIDTEYITACRTIETILLNNRDLTEVFFVYNYEGVSFRVFKSHLELINFFQNKSESHFCFDTENELDVFLAEVKLVA